MHLNIQMLLENTHLLASVFYIEAHTIFAIVGWKIVKCHLSANFVLYGIHSVTNKHGHTLNISGKVFKCATVFIMA